MMKMWYLKEVISARPVFARVALALAAVVILSATCLTSAGVSPAAATSASETKNNWAKNLPPVTIVTNGWISVRDILQNVAGNSRLGLQMAPDVAGKINVHLENMPVDKALDALLDPIGLGYEVQDDVLVVHKRGMVTRFFNFDYPVTEREGRGELEVSAGSQSSGEGSSGGGGDGGNQNKSHVTSTASMSVWPQVMESLKVLAFHGDELEGLESKSGEDTSMLNLSDSTGRILVVNPMASLIQITAEWDRVNRIEKFLGRMSESLQRQVAIEVRILEVYLNEDNQSGVNWTTLARGDANASLTTVNTQTNIGTEFFQFVVNSKDITGLMQAVATSGDLRAVSTPRVTTLSNQKAVVRIVTEEVYYESEVEPAIITNGVATEPVISYTPKVAPVGVVLDVTPQVSSTGTITLNVHPTITNIVGIAESPNEDSTPIVSVRELDTVGKVNNGQTLVIAGLLSERTQLEKTGVPILKDIPLLGYFFGKTHSQKQNIELVMLLTPVVITNDNADDLASAAKEKFSESF